MTEHATVVFELPATDQRVRCLGCADRLCESLTGVGGVGRVDCDAQAGSVRVEFDPARLSEKDLERELERFGLELRELIEHASWRVEGLD